MTNRQFTANDGFKLQLYEASAPNPRATLVIAHGMAEHGKRYARFAEHLNALQINVVVPDLRGHGETSRINGTRGSFGTGKRNRVIVDLEEIASEVRRVHGSKHPVFLLGHSMGSMLAMRVAQRQNVKLSGLVLSAFPVHPGALVVAGKLVGNLLSAIYGKDTPSKFMDQLTFGKFTKGIANRRTDFDWLSRDAAEVDAYIADPDCGEVFTNSFFGELARLTDDAHKHLVEVDPILPVLYIAGDDDPVVGKAPGFQKNAAKMKTAIPLLETRLYAGGRHELLNDTCRDEVIADIAAFILKRS